jgi:hypothetical protein
MAVFEVKVGQNTYSVNVDDAAQLAALEVLVSKHNSGLYLGDKKDPEDHPDFVADEGEYLSFVMESWALSNPGFSEQEVRGVLSGALASYAGQHPPEEAVPAPVPSKAALLAYAAHKRWTYETRGAIWNGNLVHTDRESQTKLLAVQVQIGMGLRPDPSPWKFKGGFANISNADMLAVISAAVAHVQGAFAKEAALEQSIAAGSVTTREQIDAVFV